MRGVIFASLMVLFSSCSSATSDSSVELKGDSINSAIPNQSEVRDSIMVIRLSDGVSFNWNNQSHRIVEDTLLRSVVAIFPQKKQSIIARILDTTKTPARACSIDRNLLVGDLAFLLIDKVRGLPYYEVLGVQRDAYDGCPYPVGLLDYINDHRSEVHSKVESYLAPKE